MGEQKTDTAGIVAVTLGAVAIVSSLIVGGYAAIGFGLVGAAVGAAARRKAVGVGLGLLGAALGVGAIAFGVIARA